MRRLGGELVAPCEGVIHPPLVLGKPRTGIVHARLGPRVRLGRAQRDVKCGRIPANARPLLPECRHAPLLDVDRPFEQPLELAYTNGAVRQEHEFVEGREKLLVTRTGDALDLAFHPRADSGHVAFEHAATLVEEILGPGVELRAEELAKQRLAFPRLGVEDRGEIVLGDHDDATELVGVDTQELDDGFRDVGIARGK